jgi:peptidoglycan/xylan/chitin deacetylase (PgdA/CDA1 family)
MFIAQTDSAPAAHSNMMTMLRRAVPVTLLLIAAYASTAQAASCPGNPGALGVSRVLTLDPHGVRVGTKSFPQTLALGPHEVVLTFDDGPNPGTTPKVLAALAHECVKATFFLIGRNAQAHPGLVRRIAAAGHTIGHHSMTHPMTLARISYPAAVKDIDRGISAVEKAAGPHVAAPFFRFPGFESTPALLSYLDRKGYAVFGADLWASDWNPMTPEVELALVMKRLNHAGRGIILLHDPRGQTARMIPAFLAALKAGGWKVVQLIPARTGH